MRLEMTERRFYPHEQPSRRRRVHWGALEALYMGKMTSAPSTEGMIRLRGNAPGSVILGCGADHDAPRS